MLQPDEIIQKYLQWQKNPPDYHDVCKAFDDLGNVRAQIAIMRREIKKIQEEIDLEIDRPRSNEAKKRKITATSSLEDRLAELEAEEAKAEQRVKKLEYHKAMISNGNWSVKLKNDMGF
jgi:uncharacterized protein (DUF3084 family)